MKNLNTIIFNSDLTVSSQTEKPIQAFSSFQNIIRVIVPFGTEYVPFGIFHATNATNDVAIPSQFILMLPAGTVDIGGENYFVYEQKVPEAIVASLRATHIEFVLSLWAKADDFIGVQRYDETAQGYNTTTFIANALLHDFPNAQEDEYVRVFNTETDWQFNGTSWVNTGDVFETVLEDSRSEIVQFALYRGKSTGKPTHKPNNTEALIDAINLKVSKTGDTMTGALQFANAQLTRLIMGNNNITTDAGINATTFANGNFSSDAVKFSNFAALFNVSIATPTGGQTWIDTVAAALSVKFNQFVTQAQLDNDFFRRDGSLSMQGNLNMGSNQITNVGNVDGVDISAFKSTTDSHIGATNNPHSVTAAQTGAYTIAQTNTLLDGKAAVSHTHPISEVTNLQTTLDTLAGNISALSGAFIFRGVVSNTTAQVTADTGLLTARIVELLTRQPQTGDVLKDTDGGEWYFDGGAWRFVGQSFVDLSPYLKTTDANDTFAPISHTHVEADITDLDKYTQSQVNTLLDGKANVSHTHVEADITDLDKYTQTEVNNLLDGKSDVGHTHLEADITDLDKYTQAQTNDLLDDKMELDGSNSAIDELSFENKVDDERVSKLFVEGCCIKYQHDDGLQIRLGKELVFRNFKNATGSVIPKGTPVMFAGQQGQSDVTLIKPATVDTNEFWNLIDFPQAFFGLASQDIADDDFGAITHFGDVEDIVVTQTTGSVLYFDPSTGGLTTTRPNGVNPEIIVGIVRRQSVGGGANGIIFVRPSISFRVEDLMGVAITNIADKQTIVYDSELGYYVNKTIVLDSELFADGKIKADLIPFQFEDVLQGFFDGSQFFEEDTFDTVIPAEEGKLYINLANNTLYRFNGSAYVLIIDAAEIQSINDIPDVVIAAVANDEALVYNSTSGKWENKPIPRTVTALTDTAIDGATNGQVLTWNGTAWVNAALPTQALNDLTDVVIDTPAANNLLVYNGTNFTNQAGSSDLVQLGQVQNFGIATQQQAELGTESEKYMTPLLTAQAIAALTPAETGLANVEYYTTTIATGDWSGTDPVTAVKTVSGVLSTDKPLIDIDLSSVAFANVEAKQTEYAKIFRVAATDANEITFFATEAPTEELVIQIKVVR